MWLLIAFIPYSLISECRSSDNSPDNTVFSKYAKVAKWGTDSIRKQENTIGHAGQSLWSQRMDANIAENNNPSKERIFRQYPVYRKTSGGYEKSEKVPGVGEVIQDRFNVRPYMGYGQISSKPSGVVPLTPYPAQYNPQQNLPTFDSYSVVSTQGPPSNLYKSPYNSYNPSNAKPDANLENYPPLVQNSYDPTPLQDQATEYKPGKHGTLGPPLSPEQDFPDTSDQEYDEHDMPDDKVTQSPKDTGSIYYPPDFGGDGGHPGEPEPNIGDTDDTKSQSFKEGGTPAKDAPPKHPPKSIDDVYYPDYNGGNDEPVGSKPPVDDMMDLAPPDSQHGNYQPYLYDDHHVYEEVPHTTTEETKKRVSNNHYSYYYLGRKLWYIPLYFSIYFIIYVMILIVKAVARHKVQYKHDWLSAHSRSSRKLGSDGLDGMKTVDDIHRNVTKALDNLNKKYLNFAM